ncbi:MAG: 16S rRNA (guanine(527)-N(7))-methyltransferase RsmG [Gammaproteobacteria bacterium]|nr:16S rRNA (guanine(527)-N(7))-methyltransferase RsmG [Gammaproteobacteria bacterium]MCD8543262.1 16S rRNA (guanine(527)-N(7))-methyltransferase RsmG [Gammaproteobacteria bacterium]
MIEALHNNGLMLDMHQIMRLTTYLEQLNHWNRAYNLTAITDPMEQVYKHIVDSLCIHEAIKGERIADIGTGAGLPGIPLAIMFPEKQFTLVDSHHKRIMFIQHVVITLKLSNVMALHHRVETFRPSGLFDAVVSRAFSSLHDFVEKTQHLLIENGELLAMKGEYPSDELGKIPRDFYAAEVKKLVIHGLQAERHLVRIKRAVSPEIV